MRREAEVFVAEGTAIESEPVTYTAYSAGLGFSVWGIRWNVAYEVARVKYEDIWGSAISRNREMRRMIAADISYTIPMGR